MEIFSDASEAAGETPDARLLRLQAAAPATLPATTAQEDDAAGEFIRAGAELVRRRARSRLGVDAAEDVSGDTALKLQRYYNAYRAHPNPKAYAALAGRSAMIDFHRDRGLPLPQWLVEQLDDADREGEDTYVVLVDEQPFLPTPQASQEALGRSLAVVAEARAQSAGCPRHGPAGCAHDADSYEGAREAFCRYICGDTDSYYTGRHSLQAVIEAALRALQRYKESYIEKKARLDALVCYDWWFYRFVEAIEGFDVDTYARHPANGPHGTPAWEMPLPILRVNDGYAKAKWVRDAAGAIGPHRWNFLRTIQLDGGGELNRFMYPIAASHHVYRSRDDLAAIIDIHLQRLSEALRKGVARREP